VVRGEWWIRGGDVMKEFGMDFNDTDLCFQF